METEELVELSFPKPPTWKEFDAASKKKLGKHVRLLQWWIWDSCELLRVIFLVCSCSYPKLLLCWKMCGWVFRFIFILYIRIYTHTSPFFFS